MTGPSDKALEAGQQRTGGYGIMAVEAAYPIIRADVISEVVAALREKAAESLEGVAAYDSGSLYERAHMRREHEAGYYRAADFVEGMIGDA